MPPGSRAIAEDPSHPADDWGVAREYEIYRCRCCGRHAFGGFEEVFHLRNGCPGLDDPGDHIERVTVVEVAAEPIVGPGDDPIAYPGRQR
jgi:hypothetical protein